MAHSISFRRGTKNSGNANALNKITQVVMIPPQIENDKTSLIFSAAKSRGFKKKIMKVTKRPHDNAMPVLISLF